MPENGHNHIVLTMHPFRDYICGWIEKVHAYYILHSGFLDTSIRKFENTNPFSVLSENDNEYVGNTRETLSSLTVKKTTGSNILDFWRMNLLWNLKIKILLKSFCITPQENNALYFLVVASYIFVPTRYLFFVQTIHNKIPLFFQNARNE